MKNLKKFFSVLMAVMMIASIFTVIGSAEEALPDDVAIVSNYAEFLTAYQNENINQITLIGDIKADAGSPEKGNAGLYISRDITIIGSYGLDKKPTISSSLYNVIWIQNNPKNIPETAEEYSEVYGYAPINVTLENINIENTGSFTNARAVYTKYGNLNLNIINCDLSTNRNAINGQPLTVSGSTDLTENQKFAPVELKVTDTSIISNNGGYAIISFMPVNGTFYNTKAEGFAAVYMKESSSGSKLTFEKDCLLTSGSETDADSNTFATVVFEGCKDVTVEIQEGSCVEAWGPIHYLFGTQAYWIEEGAPVAKNNVLKLAGNTTATMNAQLVYDLDETGSNLVPTVTGGTHNVDITEYVEGPGRKVTVDEEKGTWTVSVCQHEESDLINHEDRVDPTCTDLGTYEYIDCSCGMSLYYDDVKDEWIMFGMSGELEIPVDPNAHKTAIENKKEATCTSDGYTGDEVCQREGCKKVIKKGEVIKGGHKFVDGVCSVCKLDINVKAEAADKVEAKDKVIEEVKEVTVVETQETKNAEVTVKAEVTETLATTLNEGTDKLVEEKVVTEETAKNLEAVAEVISGNTEAVVESGLFTEEEVKEIEKAVAEGKPVIEAAIVVKPVEEKEIKEESTKAIAETAAKEVDKDAKVVQYLDVAVVLKAAGKEIGTIDNLSKAITITVAIPEELKAEGRTYKVLRNHEGTVEVLDTVLNKDGTISFTTDKFSDYALVTVDSKVPQTGDNANVPMFALVLVSAAAILVVLKKKEILA